MIRCTSLDSTLDEIQALYLLAIHRSVLSGEGDLSAGAERPRRSKLVGEPRNKVDKRDPFFWMMAFEDPRTYTLFGAFLLWSHYPPLASLHARRLTRLELSDQGQLAAECDRSFMCPCECPLQLLHGWT